jgi:hypothetical protein
VGGVFFYSAGFYGFRRFYGFVGGGAVAFSFVTVMSEEVFHGNLTGGLCGGFYVVCVAYEVPSSPILLITFLLTLHKPPAFLPVP